MVEAFWARMQVELLNRKRWKTRVEFASAIHDYIEIWHNTRRCHSAPLASVWARAEIAKAMRSQVARLPETLRLHDELWAMGMEDLVVPLVANVDALIAEAGAKLKINVFRFTAYEVGLMRELDDDEHLLRASVDALRNVSDVSSAGANAPADGYLDGLLVPEWLTEYVGRAKRARSVVLSASMAARGAAGSFRPRTRERRRAGRVLRAAVVARALSKPRRHRPRPRTAPATHGPYVYAVHIGGDINVETADVQCSASSIKSTRSGLVMPETSAASALFATNRPGASASRGEAGDEDQDLVDAPCGAPHLVTACSPCNTGKADLPLDEVGWTLLSEAHVRSDWDGLAGATNGLWERAGRPDIYRDWRHALSARGYLSESSDARKLRAWPNQRPSRLSAQRCSSSCRTTSAQT